MPLSTSAGAECVVTLTAFAPAAAGSPTSAVVSVVDPGAGGKVQLASAMGGGNPSTTVELEVVRVGGTVGDVTAGAFSYAGSGCGAGSGGAFSLTGGATSTKISVPLGATPGTTCTVTLTAFAPAAAGSPLSADVSVLNPASPGKVQLASATASGNPSTTVSLDVVRIDGTAGDVTAGAFSYSGNGCGAGSGGTFTLTGGATSAKISVPLGASPGTTCTVTLTAFAPAAAGSPLSASVTVLTPPSAGQVQFASATASGNPSTTVSLDVLRVGGTAGDITSGAFASSGSGCSAGGGGTFTLTGGATSTKVNVGLGATPGATCTVTPTSFAPASAGSPLVATITVNDPNPSGTVSLAASAATTKVGAAAITFTVNRSGSTGAASVPYTLGGTLTSGGALVAGGGALSPASPVTLAAGATSATVTYTPPASAPASPALPATLTVTLGAPAGGQLGSPAAQTVTLGSNCPAPPADMLEAQLTTYGNPILQKQLSGQVVSIPLVDTFALSGSHSGQYTFGESAGGAYTPQPVTLEFSISKCKGYVDTDYTNFCNYKTTNGNYNSMTFMQRPYSVLTDYNSVNARGYCWAPISEGAWYLNARWTYSQCAYGAATCGFAIQLNPGPY